MRNQSVVDNESNLLESTIRESSVISMSSQAFDEIPVGGNNNPFQHKKNHEPQHSFSHPPGSSETNSDHPNLQAYPQSNFRNDPQQMPIGTKKIAFEEEYPSHVKKSMNKKQQQYVNNVIKQYANEAPLPVVSFDERPIGKSNFNMTQFPEEGVQVVQTQYTLSQKLKSKAAKLKMQALDELVLLVENDPDHADVEEADIGKFLKETNPGVLERALNCFRMWVLKEKTWGDDEAKLVIENGFVNGKGNSKKIALDIVDLMYESKAECTEMTILVGLKGKTAKNIAGYLTIINELLAIYGISRMKNLKPYMHEIVSVLNREKNTAVKNQGTNLLKETYKWLSKDIVEPFLKDLKDNIKKELDSFWQTFDKETEMKAPKAFNQAVNLGPKKRMDAYELADPVDVFRKYNERFSEAVLKEEKWNEKVNLMKDFVNAATVPKILHTTDHRHINQMVRRLINHSNFNVVLWNLKILAVLAKGIRKPFTPVVRSVFPNVISKFREKKTQMIDETYNTLEQFKYCISLEDVLDDIREGLYDKVPGMRIHLLNWIGKVVEQKIQEKGQLPEKTEQALRSLFSVFEKLMGDGVAEVRSATAKNIGKMKILLGDYFFEPFDIKMSKTMSEKVNEAKAKTTVKKVSKQKEKKQSKGDNNKKKTEERQPQPQIAPRGKMDISEQIEALIPKMNHADWQKRKQSAETAINLLCQIQGRLSFACTNELLATLKVRIADPNKQLVRIFVDLTGIMFEIMNEKEMKQHAKTFICGLADGLSDKVEANRRQIYGNLNKIGGIYGEQNLLNLLGPYLSSDKDSRIQIITLILENAQFLAKADIRDYPKGIIKCLTDRNREIRALAEKLFQKVYQKIGLDVFRNITRTERPAIAKDLNSIFDKYDPAKLKKSNSLAKGISPPAPRKFSQQRPSTKKAYQKSEDKNSTKKSFKEEHEEYRKSPARGGLNLNPLRVGNGNFQQEYKNEISSRSNQHSRELKKDEFKSPNIHHRHMNSPPPPQSSKGHQHEFYGYNNAPQYNPPSNVISLSPTFPTFVQASNQFASLEILTSQQLYRNQKQPWVYEYISQAQEDDLISNLYNLIHIDLVKKMLSLEYKRVLEATSHIIKLIPSHQVQTLSLYDLLLKWVLLRLWGGNPNIQSIIEVLPPLLSTLQHKNHSLSNNELQLVVAIIREYFISAFMNNYQVSESLYSIIELLSHLTPDLLPHLLVQFKLNISALHRNAKEQSTTFYRDGLSRLIKHLLMGGVTQDMLEAIGTVSELREDEQLVDVLRRHVEEGVLVQYGFSVQKQPEQYVESQPQLPKIFQPRHMYEQQMAKVQQPPEHISPVEQEQMEEGPGISIKEDMRHEIDLSSYAVPPPGSLLYKHLHNLFPPNETSLDYISEMFAEPSPEDELEVYGKVVIGYVLRSITLMFDCRDEYSPQKIFNQITLLQHAIKCRPVIDNIGELIYNVTKFALTQLVHEDQNKHAIAEELVARGYEQRLDYFIKVINGVMLRILENANPQELTNVLLRLLCQQQRDTNPSRKTTHLIIKCLARLPNSFTQNTQIQQSHTDEFLPLFNEYLNLLELNFPLEDFNPAGEKLKPEENAIKALKQILVANIQFFREEIWVCYSNRQTQVRHDYIREFILATGIDEPSNQEDEVLIQIKQLLSKPRTFQTGITELRRYLAINPSFSPVEYFNSQGYDQRFVMTVMSSLEGKPVKRTPTKRQLREQRSAKKEQASPNIQDKIKKLKKKFESSREESFQPSMSRNEGKKFSRNQSRERAQYMAKKLDQMRCRVGNRGR